MSGDVQPRKRKDKKRKKDETAELPTHATSDDLNIHVHKEGGTGGGICAKVVFFILFSALAVLIGFIITEHRGSNDLETAEESRFSQLFEGWIDSAASHDHDEEHLVESPEEDESEIQDQEPLEEESEEGNDTEEQDDEDQNIESEEIEQDDEEPPESEEEDIPEPASEEQPEELEEEDEDEKEPEIEESGNSGLVVKIGVGVALLVVAHFVLVRKWKPAPTVEKDDLPANLSRRNTLVVPPTYQEVEQDIEETIEEDYSDEDGEVDSDVDRHEVKSAKVKYQELRTTYTRSLTPDSEPEIQKEDFEEEIEEEEEQSEDEELLERLEARYGRLHGQKEATPRQIPDESDSDNPSDDYEYENITNNDDWQIKEQIDEAQKTIQNNAVYAIKLFDALLQNYPSSPRILYGKAQSLDAMAEQKKSNELLQKAVAHYSKILEVDDVPAALFEASADRCINRLRFVGQYNRAIPVHNKLIARFPANPKHRNQLAVSYLTTNQINKAREVLLETLRHHPNDGFAMVHYGFILKTADNKLNESVVYLKRGLESKAPGVVDGRFYFHLGDALARLGRNNEAMELYEDGVRQRLFLSKYQRSLYNIDRLKGQPWWSKKETPYSNLYNLLENNWKIIREEAMAVLGKNGLFQNESENLRDTGDWKQFELFARGRKNVENCKKSPTTCKIIESEADASGCKRGQTKFSVMHPGTHVWPHCGPTNCRLRVHLGLDVPPKTYIRVADEIRSWQNGKVLVFDDSFEHEVWHNGTAVRLVLIVDVWHPELSQAEKNSLSPI